MNGRSTEQDFAAFEPLFWRVLSSLARHGFVVSPLDARDLIHDFYVDGWFGVKKRFDSKLGSFTTYLASAFYKFARRRIVALQSWRQRLVDLDLLAEKPSEDWTPPQIIEHKQQLKAIRSALSRLPSEERSVLQDYISDPEPSERTIAARHSLTRYALRERLLSAIGRVAVEMGRADSKAPESLVAFYLWREGRSPKNVSGLLGIPVSDVHELKNRFAADLLASVRSTSTPPKIQKGTSMPASLQALKTTLLRVGDLSALRSLQESAKDLRELLDRDEADLEFSPQEMRVLGEQPEWVARVYEAVAAAPEMDETEHAVETALEELRAQEETEIGEAFVTLLDALPGEFQSWRHYFGELSPLTDVEQDYLLHDPSFVEGVPHAETLSRFGLTPLMFHDAIRGLELLFDRVLEQDVEARVDDHEDPRWPHVVLTLGDMQREVSQGLLLSQFGTAPGLRHDASDFMATWVLQALQLCPQLVRGYEATDRSAYLEVIQLAPVVNRFPSKEDQVSRWSKVFVHA